MNELDELAGVRAGAPPMSAQARNAGRLRLAGAMADAAPSVLHRPVDRRRLAAGLAFGLTLAATATGAVVLGRPGNRHPSGADGPAGDPSGSASKQVPRPDQYVFTETRLRSQAPEPESSVWSWMAADGRRPGHSRLVREAPACRPSGSSAVPSLPTLPTFGAHSVNAACGWETELPVYDPKRGLASAPYTVLAQLPADPGALLAVLQADPAIGVGTSKAPGVGGPVLTREATLWGLLRDLAGRLPDAQCVALFRALSTFRRATRHPRIADAAGRTGVGFGVQDDRIGRLVLIFDRDGSQYLGEAILDQAGRTQDSSALLRTAVVDRIGQLPS